jgi:hypothetical protein
MEINEKKLNWKKYVFVFIITAVIFGCGFYLSNILSAKQIAAISKLQQGLSIDILSLETQFSVLTHASCKNLNESTLTDELYDIAQKLTSISNSIGENNPDFLMLKKYYSILEIKHWLLLNKAAKDCKMDLVSIMYFYTDQKKCPDCNDQGYILTNLRGQYPFLRVYSFDYNLPLAPLDTIKSMYKLEDKLPILVVQDDVYYGLKTKENLEEILKQYVKLQNLGSPSTSTNATTTK